MEHTQQHPRKLRWQLTLRFGIATIATLILVVAGIFGYLSYQVLVANWRLSPTAWINVAARTAVPTTRHILLEERDNSGMIAMWLSYVANPTSYFQLLKLDDIEVTLRTTGSARAYLFDENGILLGASESDEYESMAGREFSISGYPDVGENVAAALRGETDAELLVRASPTDPDAFSVAVPIFSEEDSTGQFLGVLAVRFQALASGADVAVQTVRFAALSSLVILFVTSGVAILFAFLTAKTITNRVARMASMASKWSRGDFSHFIDDSRGDEVGTLSNSLDSMAVQMSALLVEREETAVSRERTRMARDLHDSVKQTALAASFHLGTALSVMGDGSGAAERHVREADQLLDRVRAELSSLIESVYSPPEEGLNASLTRLALEWSRRTGIPVDVDLAAPTGLGCQVENGVFRIVQEALANIARHSKASHVRIATVLAGSSLRVEVSDDGDGFDPSVPASGVGLRSMRDRSLELGGSFQVESEPGLGVRIRVEIPGGQT